MIRESLSPQGKEKEMGGRQRAQWMRLRRGCRADFLEEANLVGLITANSRG